MTAILQKRIFVEQGVVTYAGRRHQQLGKIGWALLWLLGVPLPVLLIFYLIRGH